MRTMSARRKACLVVGFQATHMAAEERGPKLAADEAHLHEWLFHPILPRRQPAIVRFPLQSGFAQEHAWLCFRASGANKHCLIHCPPKSSARHEPVSPERVYIHGARGQQPEAVSLCGCSHQLPPRARCQLGLQRKLRAQPTTGLAAPFCELGAQLEPNRFHGVYSSHMVLLLCIVANHLKKQVLHAGVQAAGC